MKKINIELPNINQISEEYVNGIIEEGGLLKVTTESYYKPYETNDKELKKLAKEWFYKYGSQSHAYRDGSKFQLINLVKVEIIKR